MDNQRLIIWGFFAVMAYMTWQTWMQTYGPQPAPPPAAAEETILPADQSMPSLPATDTDLPALQSTAPDTAPVVTADEPAAATGRVVRVTTDVFEIEINTAGGVIQSASMLGYPVAKDTPEQKIQLLSTEQRDFGAIRGWLRSNNNDAPDANTVYEVTQTTFAMNGEDQLVVPLTWTSGNGVTFEKRFIFNRGNYAITLQQDIRNGSDTAWRGDQVTQLQRRSYEQERSMFDVDSYSFDGPQLFDGEKAEKYDRDDLLDDGPFSVTTDNGWYASIQHHFLSAIVPTPGNSNIFQLRVDGNLLTASVISAPQTVAAGETGSFEKTLFVGPKLQAQLDELHPKLALTVDYGWLVILSQPMFWLLSWIYSFVGNWGWAIIGVTVLIKLAFYKLTQSSGRSMAKMREIQPRMKALQDRYKDDRQALSQAMMDLYKREKVNPAAGCLPILIQMPFFLAFYWVLVESVEMRQAPFALWITDLSVRDPYFILPLIMGAAMLFQQKLNPAPADPVQARVMQIMPIMFTAFFAFFPSGLVLYWVTNTLLSIAQQWRINQVVHAETVAAKQSGGKKNKKDEKDKKDKKENNDD
ncbi:MAG: membrane protein insertase YidC [Gammaproteobacteria bacterium]|nr:membrane protein insertase YidC [Gammaproteobacteria bacterium]